MNRNIIKRLSCLVLCFCLVSISSVNVFAAGKGPLFFGDSSKQIKENNHEWKSVSFGNLLKDIKKKPHEKELLNLDKPHEDAKIKPHEKELLNLDKPHEGVKIKPHEKESFFFGNSFKEEKKKPHEKIDSIQSFILDSMDNKNNEEIAINLSYCTDKNIDKTAKNLSKILKGSWKSKKGIEKLEDILEAYLDYTPKAKYCLWSVIDEGFDGVYIPITLSNKLKSKINYDFTGNANDDRGTKFMVKSLLIFDEVAALDGENLLTVKTNCFNFPRVKLNRLEDYSIITSSIDEVLSSLDTLPFNQEDFDGFIDYYESYINDCGVYGVFSFLRLLDANGIEYTTK